MARRPIKIVLFEKENDTDHFLRSLHAVHLDHVPGQKLQYSNAGFGLLGIILERVYQMPFEELVRNKIARPSGMQYTGIMLSGSQTALLAPGHSSNGTSRPSLLLGVLGSGRLRSNIDDLLLYAQANAETKSGPLAASHRLVAGDTWGGVGLGWEIDKTEKGEPRISHDGGMLGPPRAVIWSGSFDQSIWCSARPSSTGHRSHLQSLEVVGSRFSQTCSPTTADTI